MLSLAAWILGWMLLAPLLVQPSATVGAAPHGFSAAAQFSAPAGDGPPGELHHHVVRKKLRRVELAPVAVAASPRVAPPAGDWLTLAGIRAADAGADTRPAFAGIDRGPALPAAPQLRLRPGQAPPAA